MSRSDPPSITVQVVRDILLDQGDPYARFIKLDTDQKNAILSLLLANVIQELEESCDQALLVSNSTELNNLFTILSRAIEFYHASIFKTISGRIVTTEYHSLGLEKDFADFLICISSHIYELITPWPDSQQVWSYIDEHLARWQSFIETTFNYRYKSTLTGGGANLDPLPEDSRVIDTYPEKVVEVPGDYLVIPDLHGNAFLAVCYFTLFGVFKCPEETYAELRRTYNSLCALQAFSVLHHTEYYLDMSRSLMHEFLAALDGGSVTVDQERAARLVLIGDFDADRGALDILIYAVFDLLTKDCKSVKFIVSNHGEMSNNVFKDLCKSFQISFQDLFASTSSDDINRQLFCQNLVAIATGASEICPPTAQEFFSNLCAQVPGYSVAWCLAFGDAVYPSFGGSLMHTLYLLATSEPAVAQDFLSLIVGVKRRINSNIDVLYYDPSMHVVFSHAPAPLYEFLQLALDIAWYFDKAMFQVCCEMLQGDTIRFAQKFAESEPGFEIRHKFQMIVDFVNKQYREFPKRFGSDLESFRKWLNTRRNVKIVEHLNFENKSGKLLRVPGHDGVQTGPNAEGVVIVDSVVGMTPIHLGVRSPLIDSDLLSDLQRAAERKLPFWLEWYIEAMQLHLAANAKQRPAAAGADIGGSAEQRPADAGAPAPASTSVLSAAMFGGAKQRPVVDSAPGAAGADIGGSAEQRPAAAGAPAPASKKELDELFGGGSSGDEGSARIGLPLLQTDASAAASSEKGADSYFCDMSTWF